MPGVLTPETPADIADPARSVRSTMSGPGAPSTPETGTSPQAGTARQSGTAPQADAGQTPAYRTTDRRPTDDRPTSGRAADAHPSDDQPSAPSPGWDSCSSLELAGTDERQVPGRRPHPSTPRTPRTPRTQRPPLRGLVDDHLASTLKFLMVGGLVFLLDAAMYNLLVFWHPTQGWGEGLMHANPLTAKVLTIAAASCLTYLGNRLWTFGDRPRPDTTRSIMLFILINVIASGLQLSCLGFSRYVLGLDSLLADNISGTLIGQIVSTSFRYVTYGRFVFPRR